MSVDLWSRVTSIGFAGMIVRKLNGHQRLSALIGRLLHSLDVLGSVTLEYGLPRLFSLHSLDHILPLKHNLLPENWIDHLFECLANHVETCACSMLVFIDEVVRDDLDQVEREFGKSRWICVVSMVLLLYDTAMSAQGVCSASSRLTDFDRAMVKIASECCSDSDVDQVTRGIICDVVMQEQLRQQIHTPIFKTPFCACPSLVSDAPFCLLGI